MSVINNLYMKSIRTLMMTTLISTALIGGCGMLESSDEPTNTSSNLFDDPTAPCRDLLLRAEIADDPAERDDALTAYQACVDDHMDHDGEGSLDYAACYDILEAAVRLQDDVDEDLIERLHREYVDCVFDYVGGVVDGDDGDPDGDPIDQCYEIAQRECEHLIAEEPPEGPADDGQTWNFDRCVDELLNDCIGEPAPDQCEQLLHDAEELCFGHPDEDNVHPQECWAQFEEA